MSLVRGSIKPTIITHLCAMIQPFQTDFFFKSKMQTMLYIHLKSELLYLKCTQCKPPLTIGTKSHGFSKAGEREIVCILNFIHST